MGCQLQGSRIWLPTPGSRLWLPTPGVKDMVGLQGRRPKVARQVKLLQSNMAELKMPRTEAKTLRDFTEQS